MTNVLDGIGARIDNLPRDFLDRAIDVFVDIAVARGGTMRFKRKSYALTAKPTKRTVRGDYASVIMQGVPSGFWTWMETGVGEHPIIPRHVKQAGWKPGPLAGDLDQPVWGPVIHPGYTGQGRWTRTVVEADRAIRDLAVRGADRLGA